MNAPHRRHRWTLRLEVDEHDDLVGSLRALLFDAQSRECFPNGASGGVGSGYSIEYEEDPNMTHERYVDELTAYLAYERGKEGE